MILGPYNPHYALSDKGIQGEHDINTSAQIELEFTEKHHNCYKYLALISQHSYPGRQCWPIKISNYPGSLNRQVCTGINIYSKLQFRISRKYHYLQAVKEEWTTSDKTPNRQLACSGGKQSPALPEAHKNISCHYRGTQLPRPRTFMGFLYIIAISVKSEFKFAYREAQTKHILHLSQSQKPTAEWNSFMKVT